VRHPIDGDLEFDDDPTRVDIDEVHRFLSQESYWAAGRPRQVVEQLVRTATRVVGLYDGDRLIGFARTVSDEVTFAWLGDVFVLPGYRGRGLGVALVREMIEGSGLADLRWMLGTADAHGLYAKFGFGAPSDRLMERPRPNGPDGQGSAPRRGG
jgi:GNAT superfamily N-acetyltransferase